MMIQPPNETKRPDDRECTECGRQINLHTPEESYFCNRKRLERKQYSGEDL